MVRINDPLESPFELLFGAKMRNQEDARLKEAIDQELQANYNPS